MRGKPWGIQKAKLKILKKSLLFLADQAAANVTFTFPQEKKSWYQAYMLAFSWNTGNILNSLTPEGEIA